MASKRKYIRIPGDRIKVKVRGFEEDMIRNFHGVENLSIGGLLLSYKDELNVGDYVLLTIDALEKGVQHFIKCVATVVRVEKKGSEYETAFKFEKISEDDVDYIKAFTDEYGDI